MVGTARWFVGVATTQYRSGTGLADRAALAGEVERFGQLFRSLGYQIAPGFGANLSVSQFCQRLRSFLIDPARSGDDVVTVYYTGHAIVHRGELLLPMADTDEDIVFSSLRAGDLTTRMLAGEVGVRRLLFILDTCHAAVGGAALARGGIDFVNRVRGLTESPAVGVIVAARPDERATETVFSQAFVAAIETQASGGRESEFLPLDGLVNIVNDTTPVWQHARLFYTGDSTTPFVPNPRVDRWLGELDLRTRKKSEQVAARRAEQVNHVMPRARGLDRADVDDVWLFTGRHHALRTLCTWLRNSEHTGMVVTGDPGSGKSALLARLFVLADRRLRSQIPSAHTIPPDTVPDDGSIRRFIHARGKTARDLLEAIGEACGLEDVASPGHLLQRLQGSKAMTVIVDAVDEAIGDPAERANGRFPPVDEVLAPLVRGSRRSPVRLLIGTRRHLLERFDNSRVIDLDAAEYVDLSGVVSYVMSCLVGLAENSPYRYRHEQYVRRVAEVIASSAGNSFLVALITARSHTLRDAAVDPDNYQWRASLPRLASEAMRDDLVVRLGESAQRARDLLLPLAYASGGGLPWEDLWPKLARALSGKDYTSADIDWLIEVAGFYVTEWHDQRRSLYRLYHRALAEHLRASRDEAADQATIVDVLTRHTPLLADGHCDWARAHSYIAANLAGHAAGAGRLDVLVTDPRFLLAAQPQQLLNALSAVQTRPGYLATDAYRRAHHHIRAKPAAQHAAYLQLTARCGRAPNIATAITDAGLHLTWFTHWASWRLQPPHHVITGHDGGVWSITLGGVDGRSVIVSGGADGRVRVWDAATGVAVGAPLAGHADGVWSLAFGEVGGRCVIVSGGADGAVRVRDAATGVAVGGPFIGHVGGVNAVAVGQVDGREVIASGGADRTVRVWDLATGAAVGGPFIGHVGGVWSVAVGGTDGCSVVSGGDDGTVRVWDLATGAAVGDPFTGHVGGVNAVAVGQVDRRDVVVSGSDDCTVRMWDLATGAAVGDPFTGHTEGVWSVSVGQVDGRSVIVSGSADRTVRVWDSATNAAMNDAFAGHTDGVWSVAVGQVDGRSVIVSGGDDRTVRVWDAATGVAVGAPLTGHTRGVNTLAFGEVGGRCVIVSGGADGTVRVWDAATGAVVGGPFVGHAGGVWSVACGQLGGRCVIVSGGADGAVRVRDAATGVAVGGPFIGHVGGVNAVAVGQVDGREVIASGGADRTVRVWDLATGAAVGGPFIGHVGGVWSVAVGGTDGCSVVSGGDDGTVRVWDLATGAAVGDPFTGHTSRVWSVAVGRANGRGIIVSGSDDCTVRVWDLANGAAAADRSVIGHTSRVWSVTVGHVESGCLIVAGGADGTVRVWDATTGAAVGNPFTGHTGTVWSVTAGQIDGRSIVASGGADRTVRVWDAATGVAVGAPLAGHADGVWSLAFGEVGGRCVIVSGGADGAVRVRDAATGVAVGGPFIGHVSRVWSVAIGHVGGRPVIVSGGDDRTVRVWDAATGAVVGDPIVGHTGGVHAVAVGQSDGRAVIVSGSADGSVRVWDLATGAAIGSQSTAHAGGVRSVAMAQLGGSSIIVSGGDDGVLRVSRSIAAAEILEIDLSARITSVWAGRQAQVVAATELGIVVLQIPEPT